MLIFKLENKVLTKKNIRSTNKWLLINPKSPFGYHEYALANSVKHATSISAGQQGHVHLPPFFWFSAANSLTDVYIA